jgi:hypothetical protein
MKSYVLIWVLLTSCLFTLNVNAKIVSRERPDEWNKLVYGGRFMDRFLPMPIQGELTSETWGADNVKPRYIDNGIEENEWSYWGGDSGNRVFDILIDGKKVATQKLSSPKPGQFMDVTYPVPVDLTKGKEKVTVKFQANPGSMAGGVFGCRIVKQGQEPSG